MKINFKDFIMKVLNGTAIGIVVALIPNAILGGLFRYLATAAHPIFGVLAQGAADIQWTVSPMIGFLVGLQFGFNPMKSAIISSATWIGSGALTRLPDGMLKIGLGDLINVIIVAAIASYITILLGEKLGSLTVVLQPLIVGLGAGFIGLLTLPYIKLVSVNLGQIINTFTTLQPIIMCILIAISFSIIIISPFSTVAIAIAIGLTGLGSGAANIGISAAAAVLVVGSWSVNKSGVTVALGMGAMKMMIPNLVKYPIIVLPIASTAAVAGITARIFGILGTPVSAGFGFSGLVGPIQAISSYAEQGIGIQKSLPITFFAFFVVTFGFAFLFHTLYCKVFKIYKPEIFKFQQ